MSPMPSKLLTVELPSASTASVWLPARSYCQNCELTAVCPELLISSSLPKLSWRNPLYRHGRRRRRPLPILGHVRPPAVTQSAVSQDHLKDPTASNMSLLVFIMMQYQRISATVIFQDD